MSAGLVFASVPRFLILRGGDVSNVGIVGSSKSGSLRFFWFLAEEGEVEPCGVDGGDFAVFRVLVP